MYFLYRIALVLCAQSLILQPLAIAAGTVGIRLSFEPATLDWNLGDVPIHVINNVAEGLYSISESGQVVANEATGPPEPLEPDSSGNPRFLVRLRDSLKWSDGKPVTAHDYIYSWTRLLDPKTASTYAQLLFDLKGSREFNRGKAQSWIGAKALNDREIELVATGLAPGKPGKKCDQLPHLSVFTHWATFPVRKDLVSKYGPQWAQPPHMVFNGPYRILDYRHDVRLDLVPNEAHRQPGKLARIEALIIPDDATALRLYESGRLHFLSDLGTLDHNRIAARSDYHAKASPVLVYLGVDANYPLLGQNETRAAVSASIDRNIIPKIMGTSQTPVATIAPRTLLEEQLPAAGDQKLKQGAARLSGKTVTLGYFEKGQNRMLVEFVQAQLKKNLGLLAKLESSEVKSYWNKLAQQPFPLFLNTYGPPVWDVSFYFNLLRSDNPMNMGRWKNAVYERAVEKQNWKLASQILADQTPIIPLYFRSYEYLISPSLNGAVLNPMTSLYLDQARVER